MPKPRLALPSAGAAAGPLFALLAFAAYSTHDAVIKHLGASYSVFQILFFSTLLSFPLVVIMLLRDPEPGTLRPRYPGWSLLRTATMVISWAAVFYAFSVLPLAQTYAILFATPLLITLLAIPLLGERVGLHRGAAVLVGIVGVMIVLRPGTTDLTLGHAAALLASVGSAFASVIVRRIGREERAAVLMIYPMLAGVVVMGFLQPAVYLPMALADLAAMGVVAALAFAAMLMIIEAYRRAEATVVAPMQYSQIVWATVFGWLFFNETPDGGTILGAAVVIASGLYIVFREARADVSINRPVSTTRTRIAPVTSMPAGPAEPAR